jgi:hypothetical protein
MIFANEFNLENIVGKSFKVVAPIGIGLDCKQATIKIIRKVNEGPHRGGHRKQHAFFEIKILNAENNDGSNFEDKVATRTIDILTLEAEQIKEVSSLWTF